MKGGFCHAFWGVNRNSREPRSHWGTTTSNGCSGPHRGREHIPPGLFILSQQRLKYRECSLWTELPEWRMQSFSAETRCSFVSHSTFFLQRFHDTSCICHLKLSLRYKPIFFSPGPPQSPSNREPLRTHVYVISLPQKQHHPTSEATV